MKKWVIQALKAPFPEKAHHLPTRRIPQKRDKSFPKRRLKRRGVTSLNSTSHFARINAPQAVIIINGHGSVGRQCKQNQSLVTTESDRLVASTGRNRVLQPLEVTTRLGDNYCTKFDLKMTWKAHGDVESD